jgi:hypothetical protein
VHLGSKAVSSREERIRYYQKSSASKNIDGEKRHPQYPEQTNVLLHRITRRGGELHACHQLLSATRAILRSRRQRASTFFTEHGSPLGSKYPLNNTQGSHREFPYIPAPQNKAGTEKNIRSVKEGQSKHQKRIVPRPRRVNRQQTKRPPGNSGGLFFKGE